VKATAKWAWKVKHWTPENLSPYVIMIDKRRERVRSRTITQAQVEKLLRHAPNFETRAFIALGFYGLMRRGEMVKAKPEDVARGITLPDTKNGETRVVPVVPQLRPFLKAIPFQHHPRTLYEWFEGARDAAGLEGLVHHDLRRSGATWLLNSGYVSLDIVAHILGNSLEVARKVYARVLNRTAEKAMRKGFKVAHQKPIGRRRPA
jgi:integrase